MEKSAYSEDQNSLVILDYMEDILFIKHTLENRHSKVVITAVGKD